MKQHKLHSLNLPGNLHVAVAQLDSSPVTDYVLSVECVRNNSIAVLRIPLPIYNTDKEVREYLRLPCEKENNQ